MAIITKRTVIKMHFFFRALDCNKKNRQHTRYYLTMQQDFLTKATCNFIIESNPVSACTSTSNLLKINS